MPKPLRFLSPIHKAAREVGVYFERLLGDSGLAPQEGHILSYLRSYAPCPIAEVVTVFGLRGSTATSVLDRLEERGLLARRPNPDDRRSFLIDLTAEGKRVAERVQTYVDALERAIARKITPKEEEGFRAVMAAIHEVTEVTLVERGVGRKG
jgi:DNA-binding MarR family transcriptional regulator